MTKLIAFTASILPGKTDECKSFINELKTNWAKDFTESRQKLQIHERTFLQTTPTGDFVIVTLEGPEPEKSFQTFTESKDPFAKWFLSKVKEIHGLELKDVVTMTPTMVIDSETVKVPATFTSL